MLCIACLVTCYGISDIDNEVNIMDQITQILYFILAIIPIIVIFAGLVFFKKSGTFMGIVGWIVCLVIALLFFWGSPRLENSELSAERIALWHDLLF